MRKDLLKNVKGMRDFSPKDMLLREKILNIIKNNFKLFGFLPIETPTLESYPLLMDKYGEDADKLIYNFKDRADRPLGMIYDLTVPLSRFVAMNINNLTLPFKRYQIQRVYRYENPQKGRFREFYQCDIDTIGSDSPFVEAELLIVSAKILKELGLDFKIKLNFRTFLDDYLEKNNIAKQTDKELFLRAIDKLDKMGDEKVIAYLKENDFPKDPKPLLKELSELKQAPDRFVQIENYFSTFYDREYLEFSPLLARGLSYYTDTIFEISLRDEDMGSIAGGGRYDNLINHLINREIPACGIALGFERIFEILKKKKDIEDDIFYDYFIMNSGNKDQEMKLLKILTKAGKKTFYYPDKLKMDKQLKKAVSLKSKYFMIMGDEEVEKGEVSIKDLLKREQKRIKLEEFIRSIS